MKSSNEIEQIKNIIYRHLDKKRYQLLIFGSRATGSATRFSDYDIGILGKKKVALKKMSLIKEDLEESDLPFTVDVVDLSNTTEKFKKVALSSTIKI